VGRPETLLLLDILDPDAVLLAVPEVLPNTVRLPADEKYQVLDSSDSILCSRNGLPATGSRGFGMLEVNGLILTPSPAVKMYPFTPRTS
jgi:hypothetical protein